MRNVKALKSVEVVKPVASISAVKEPKVVDIVKSAPMPPKELREAAIYWLMEKGIDPTPENIMRNRKRRGFPLKEWFASIPLVDFASYGMYTVCRRIIEMTPINLIAGGKTITETAAKFVGKDWEPTSKVIEDPALRLRYLDDVTQRLNQAIAALELAKKHFS